MTWLSLFVDIRLRSFLVQVKTAIFKQSETVNRDSWLAACMRVSEAWLVAPTRVSEPWLAAPTRVSEPWLAASMRVNEP